jgi:hypothetical protein
MSQVDPEHRSKRRRQQDEQLANEAPLKSPELRADAVPEPVESHLQRHKRNPVAVAGIVENGVVRPLDRSVKLPEHARVIIVASNSD